jgi:hypothetical protein
MRNQKEFIILGVVEGHQCHVIGRCCDAPIGVGDHFDAVYRYRAPQTDEDYAKEPQREGEEYPVSLTVESIQAYEKQIRRLSPGMTGSLAISGAGCNRLGQGWVLGESGGKQRGL